MKRLARWMLRRAGRAFRPAPIEPPAPEWGTLVPIEEIAFGGKSSDGIASASHAGTANRLRCLLTSAMFSENLPTLYWPVSGYDHPIHEHETSDARDIFSTTVVPLARGHKPPLHCLYNHDWHLLSHDIMKLPGNSRSLCVDALNGDGVKNCEMVYMMPDNIFYSFQECLNRLLSPSYLAKIDSLVAQCRQRQYGMFALRYWIDCRRSLSLSDLQDRTLTHWQDAEQLRQYLQLICAEKKWTRTPPSLAGFRSARAYMQDVGIQDILITSDRFFSKEIYDPYGSIGMALQEFKSGPERLIATLYVIANARVVCRSKDSTYSHFSALLGDKWSKKFLDL